MTSTLRRPAIALSLAALAAAAWTPSASAQGTAQTAARPQAAPTQQQSQIFANLAQVCQMRERELVVVNSELVTRSRAAAAEKDQARRGQLLAPMDQLRANLRETEASWNRMECVRLLYGR